jgi:Uma2 family endonuclease
MSLLAPDVPVAEPHVYRWTRDEYYKMAEAGLFDGKHVELIEGLIIEMSPMRSRHRTSVVLTGDALRKVFSQGYFISTQCPLNLGEASEPEPDVAVIAGNVRDYVDAHPTTAALIVEIAETSLAYDRTYKMSLYAKAGILDYWIVNIMDRQLEVHRNPRVDTTQPYRFGYADITILTVTDSVTPLVMPQAVIAVADLLP